MTKESTPAKLDGSGKPIGNPDDKPIGVPMVKIVTRTLGNSEDLVVLEEPQSFAAEKFRRLMAMLSGADSKNPRCIVVTSAVPGEGKTVVTMNTALAFASGGNEKVIVLDGDLRRPSFDRWITPKANLGIVDILEGRTTLEHTVLNIKETPLKVLPAGKASTDPVALLSSDKMVNLMAALREEYDRILIDTPPIVPFTDADVFGRFSDGILLVVRMDHTPVNIFKQALEVVSSAPILGTVLNGSTRKLADRGYYAEEYYNKYYDKGKRKR